MACDLLKHCIVSSILMLVVLRSSAVLGEISCLDNDGKPVDWFVVLKMPQKKKNQHETVLNGVGQLYMDANNNQLTLLDRGIDEIGGHAVYNTLEQISANANSKKVAYLQYNDQILTDSVCKSVNGERYGHTKGDLCFDDSTGFWLVHSAPCLGSQIEYEYPENAKRFGQSFLCVTYGYDQLDTIAKQLLYNHVYLISQHAPPKFIRENPNLAKLCEEEHGGQIDDEPTYNKALLTSHGGQEFTSYAKTRDFNDYDGDLYAWVADDLKSSVYVETWHGKQWPSHCKTKYKIANVVHLNYLDGEISFKETKDHSKWAVTFGKRDDTVCIGDLNRHEGQELRAGGTVCSQLPTVAKELTSAIDDDGCRSPKRARDEI